jgi:tetratricopeptide (TPR) repeat protein
MNPKQIQVDEHGLPVAQGFGDEPPRRGERSAARWYKTRPARKVLGVIAVLAVMVPLLYPKLRTSVPPMLAEWWHNRAQQRYYSDNLGGALSDLDLAIGIVPDDHELHAELFRLRGLYRLDDHEREGHLQEAIPDFDRAIELDPKLADAYKDRSRALQRLGQHRAGLDDLERYVKLRPKNNPQALNARAYGRALAETELYEALQDIQQAIKSNGAPEAAYLDTRGWIHYLRGDYKAALADLDLAIVLAKKEKLHWFGRLHHDPRIEPGRRSFLMRRFDENLGVMHHHRGKVHEKLGSADQADSDLQLGKELGYDPARGVW